jgi:hypothetical protein
MDTIYKIMIACTRDYIHNMRIEYERDNNFEPLFDLVNAG